MQLQLFNVMVLPVIKYVCEIWSYDTIGELEILHMKFLKHILYTQENTSTDVVYGELGEYSIEVIINNRMIDYWARLITGKVTKLSSVMYQCLVYLDFAGKFTSLWINHIRCILLRRACILGSPSAALVRKHVVGRWGRKDRAKHCRFTGNSVQVSVRCLNCRTRLPHYSCYSLYVYKPSYTV